MQPNISKEMDSDEWTERDVNNLKVRAVLGEHYHPSVVLEFDDLDLSPVDVGHSKCAFCPAQLFYGKAQTDMLTKHMQTCHWDPGVKFKELTLMQCSCFGGKKHYHCAICGASVIGEDSMKHHNKIHDTEIANGLLTHTLYDVFMDDMIVEIQDNNISSDSPMRKKHKRSLETDILSEAEIITMSDDWKEIEEELITDINGKDNTDIHQVFADIYGVVSDRVLSTLLHSRETSGSDFDMFAQLESMLGVTSKVTDDKKHCWLKGDYITMKWAQELLGNLLTTPHGETSSDDFRRLGEETVKQHYRKAITQRTVGTQTDDCAPASEATESLICKPSLKLIESTDPDYHATTAPPPKVKRMELKMGEIDADNIDVTTAKPTVLENVAKSTQQHNSDDIADDVTTDDTEARVVVVKRELPEVPCDQENIEPLDTSRTVEKPESMNHDETNDTTSVVLGLEDIEYVEDSVENSAMITLEEADSFAVYEQLGLSEEIQDNGNQVITIQLKAQPNEENNVWTVPNLNGRAIEGGITIPQLPYVIWDAQKSRSVLADLAVHRGKKPRVIATIADLAMDEGYHNHLREDHHKCPLCDLHFYSRWSFFEHLAEGNCLMTQKNSINPSLLRFLQSVEAFVPHRQCPHCRFKFESRLSARVHFMSDGCQLYDPEMLFAVIKQISPVMFKCKQCEFSNRLYENIFNHVGQNHPKMITDTSVPRVYECTMCTKSYAHMYYLRRHATLIHNIPSSTTSLYVICQTCGKAVKNKEFNEHIETCLPKVKTKAPVAVAECTHPGCKYMARSQKALNRHVQGTHRSANMVCEYCDTMFSLKSDLDAHVSNHHFLPGSDGLKYKCPICKKEMLKKNLRKHINDVHHKIRNYICATCGGKFQTLYTLKCHTQLHLPENERTKNYPCEFCGKKFLTLTRYRTHKSMHTGQKFYDCHACNKSFSSAFNMKCHFISKHTDTTFRCEHCKKKFREPKALKKHFRMAHTVDEGKNCLCGATFGTPLEMRSHKFTCPVYQSARAKTFPTQPPKSALLQKLNKELPLKEEELLTVLSSSRAENVEFNIADHAVDPVQGVVDSIQIGVVDPVQRAVNPVQGTVDPSQIGVVAPLISEELSNVVEEASTVTIDSSSTTVESNPVDENNYMCGFCYQLYNSVQDVEHHMHVEHAAEMTSGEIVETTELTAPMELGEEIVKMENFH